MLQSLVSTRSDRRPQVSVIMKQRVWRFCHKLTHFLVPSLHAKIVWRCNKIDKYQVWCRCLIWHNVFTWSDKHPRPSVSPGRHTYQQCCICRDSQGSANYVLETARNQLNYAGGTFLCTVSWGFPQLKDVLVKTSKHSTYYRGNKASVHPSLLHPSSTLWICRPAGCIFRCRTRCSEWSCGRLTLQVIASPSLRCKLPEAINCTVCTLHRTFLSSEGMRKRPTGKIERFQEDLSFLKLAVHCRQCRRR